MRKATLALLGAIGVVVAAACGRMQLGNPADDTLVYFSNESTEQATLYVQSSAEETRMGTVSAGRTDTLRVPDDIAARGQVRFVARLLARSETPSSGTVNIRRGDKLIVRLPPSRSTLAVLPGG